MKILNILGFIVALPFLIPMALGPATYYVLGALAIVLGAGIAIGGWIF